MSFVRAPNTRLKLAAPVLTEFGCGLKSRGDRLPFVNLLVTAPQLKRISLGGARRMRTWLSSVILVVAASAVASVACDTRGPSAKGDSYVLLAVNGRPLPVRDSMQMYDGSRRPLVELQAATLTIEDSARALLTSTQRDLFAAAMPCEALRHVAELESEARGAPPSKAPAGSLGAISDTTTTGCDELSTATRTAPARLRVVGDSLHLTIPDSGRTDTVGATIITGSLYDDSVVITRIRSVDTAVYMPFGRARLLFVRAKNQH